MTVAGTRMSPKPDVLSSSHAAPRLPLAEPAHGPRVYPTIRRSVEWCVALGLLVVMLPLLLVLAVLVRSTTHGPAIYSQVRLGRGGRQFRILKFRTMRADCEAATGPVWSIANDPRTTRVGRWLRASHLDELPQLWNVLRGEMSLIGPRPERPEIAEKIERVLPAFRDRLRVPPGITGLAQMLQPADEDLETVRHKLAHDLQYVRHTGPELDLRIAVSTVLHLSGVAAVWSRRLVEPFASSEPVGAPVSAAPLQLSFADHRARMSAEAAKTEALPKAA